MYCVQCGTLVETDSKYCVSCGSSMNKVDEDRNAVCNSATNVNDRPDTVSKDIQGIPGDSMQVGMNTYTEEKSSTQENNKPGELSEKRRKPLSLGQSIFIMIVTLIPLLNIVMLLMWSFKKNTNVNRQNIARAILIITVISFIIYIILRGKVI